MALEARTIYNLLFFSFSQQEKWQLIMSVRRNVCTKSFHICVLYHVVFVVHCPMPAFMCDTINKKKENSDCRQLFRSSGCPWGVTATAVGDRGGLGVAQQSMDTITLCGPSVHGHLTLYGSSVHRH